MKLTWPPRSRSTTTSAASTGSSRTTAAVARATAAANAPSSPAMRSFLSPAAAAASAARSRARVTSGEGHIEQALDRDNSMAPLQGERLNRRAQYEGGGGGSLTSVECWFSIACSCRHAEHAEGDEEIQRPSSAASVTILPRAVAARTARACCHPAAAAAPRPPPPPAVPRWRGRETSIP